MSMPALTPVATCQACRQRRFVFPHVQQVSVHTVHVECPDCAGHTDTDTTTRQLCSWCYQRTPTHGPPEDYVDA